jgi:hypothetical protein
MGQKRMTVSLLNSLGYEVVQSAGATSRGSNLFSNATGWEYHEKDENNSYFKKLLLERSMSCFVGVTKSKKMISISERFDPYDVYGSGSRMKFKSANLLRAIDPRLSLFKMI